MAEYLMANENILLNSLVLIFDLRYNSHWIGEYIIDICLIHSCLNSKISRISLIRRVHWFMNV